MADSPLSPPAPRTTPDPTLVALGDAAQELGCRLTHNLKVWPQYAAALDSGVKTFEFRVDDRDFREGQYLHLREWVPVDDARPDQNEDWWFRRDRFTGRAWMRRITYVARGGVIPEGYCVMAIVPLSADETDSRLVHDPDCTATFFDGTGKPKPGCIACEYAEQRLKAPAPTPNEGEMHGRAADQFPRGARSWVEVGPNMGGGITVTTYQDDERSLRGQPTYLVTNVGMPIAVARALAARIIAHCDSLSPAPSCYGSRDMGTDIPKGDDDGRQTAGSGNKQRHESPACAEGVGTGSSMPEVSAEVGARHTEPRTTVSSSTMPLVPTRGSDERPVASPAPTDRVQEIEARLENHRFLVPTATIVEDVEYLLARVRSLEAERDKEAPANGQ